MTFFFICRSDTCPHKGELRSIEVDPTPVQDEGFSLHSVYVPGTVWCDGGGTIHRAGDHPLPWPDEVQSRYEREHSTMEAIEEFFMGTKDE